MKYIILSLIIFFIGCENNGGYHRPPNNYIQAYQNQNTKSNIKFKELEKVKQERAQKEAKLKELEKLKKEEEVIKARKELKELEFRQKQLEIQAQKEIAKINAQKELELQKIKANSEKFKVTSTKEVDLKNTAFKEQEIRNNFYIMIVSIIAGVIAFIVFIIILYKFYKKSQDTKVTLHQENINHEKDLKDKELKTQVVTHLIDKLSDKNLTRADKDKLLMTITTVSTANNVNTENIIEYKKKDKDEEIIEVEDGK